MTEEEALWQAIGEMPEDELRRLVAADWHEERPGEVACERCRGKGDWTSYKGPGTTGGIRFTVCPNCHGTGRVSNGNAELAEALRATADRVPYRFSMDRVYGWYTGRSEKPPEKNRDHVEHLSVGVRLTESNRNTVDTDWFDYPTASAAIRDLCRAWVKHHKGKEVTA